MYPLFYSLLHAILHRSARPFRKADPAIPAKIERVVLKALEKAPAVRYQTMVDFLSDLKAMAEGTQLVINVGERQLRYRLARILHQIENHLAETEELT